MKRKDETLGMALGILGVTIFAVTLPMTRLATGTHDAPQLSPWFVTLARAALAGCLSVIFLLTTRSPLPKRHHWKPLGLAVLGNAVGYPLLLGLVVMFSVLRAHQHGAGFGFEWADLLLLGAVFAAAIGYIYGAQVTPELGAERVICWVCVLALPVSLPGTLWLWPQHAVAPSAWGGLLYVGVFSMWAGFFAWYRGLMLGGALRVSQAQLLQPFLSILAAHPAAVATSPLR